MILTLMMLLLILAIAFYQTTQGLFGALIMAIASLVCVMIAFNYYESLAALMYTQPLLADAADAISLVGLLIVSLLAARVLLDRFLGVNIVPGMWIDRIGGGVFGLITAMLLIGTVLVAMQMLPFGRKILDYDPYSDDLKPAGIFPYADDFVLGTVEKLSGSSMKPVGKDRQSFGQVHDNLKLELWGTRNRPHLARTWAKPDGVRVLNVWDVTGQPYPGDPSKATYGQKAPMYPGLTDPSRVLAVRVSVASDARDEIDKYFRLSGTQFRLVAADGRSYFPVGYLQVPSMGWKVIDEGENVGKWFIQEKREDEQVGEGLKLDLLYRVAGEDEKPALSFLSFRRTARAELPAAEVGHPGKAGALGTVPVTDRTTMVDPAGPAKLPFVSESLAVDPNLPMAFRSAVTGANQKETIRQPVIQATIYKEKLFSGTINGAPEKIEGPQDRYIMANYQEPNQRVVKLVARAHEQRQSNTIALGRPQLILEDGRALPAVGGWVVYSTGSDDQTMMHYHYSAVENQADPVVTHIQAINAILGDSRNKVTECGLLFLVPQGSTVVGVRIGEMSVPTVNPMVVAGQ